MPASSPRSAARRQLARRRARQAVGARLGAPRRPSAGRRRPVGAARGAGTDAHATPAAPPTLRRCRRRSAAAADAGAGPDHAATVGPVGAVSARFTRYLKELLTSAEGSANIVVLRTPAGAAQFLASTIDHAAWPAILGTVAGDDTVLVISRDPTGGEALAAEFRQLAEGRR